MTAARAAIDVPTRVIWHGATPIVEIRRIESSALGQAFWDDLVQTAPVVRICPLDDLPEPGAARGQKRATLRGGIFHTYRCGSTWLCRQLSAISGVYAIAEPAFLNQVVTGAEQTPSLLRGRLLRLMELLAFGLGPAGQQIVIKWPGLLGDRASQIAAALPDVPMLFLTREPLEVLASIEQRPLGNIDSALKQLGLAAAVSGAGESGTIEAEKAAAVIAHLCRAVAMVPAIRRCDYRDLDPLAVAQHFGLDLDDNDRTAVAGAAGWYSKARPGTAGFADDSAQKRAAASLRVRELADEILEPALQYARTTLAPLPAR